MTDSSSKKLLRKLRGHLTDSDGHHADALEVNDQARDGEIGLKDALADTRKALVASRAHIAKAHSLCGELLRARGEDDDNAELSTVSTRRKALDDLDRIHVGGSARPPTAIQLGGGSHTVNHCREAEVARLRALW